MKRKLLIQLHKKLIKAEATVACAESCTGGLLCARLTDLPGSSAFFVLGIVAYSNPAKIRVLGIPPLLISKHGAVSAQVAKAMALCARKKLSASYGIGITGIAGPGGGSRNKPVGTVFIAVCKQGRMNCKKYLFKGNRITVRNSTVSKALQMLYSIL